MAGKRKNSNIKSGTKSTIQIVNMSTSTAKPKRQRSKKQTEAAKANIAKARAAKASYAQLRTQGFDRTTILEATQTIQDELTRTGMTAEINPAVAQLYSEIGAFKTEDEIEQLSKAEYYKYATSIRSFLGNPLSSVDAQNYLNSRLSQDLFAQSLLIRDNEDFAAYKERRRKFVKATEDTISKKAFELYRRVMETNAGQIIRAKQSPAAYGSDNLIVDLFDFVSSGQWYDNDVNFAAGYWQDIIQNQYNENLETLREVRNREGLELQQFDWKGVRTYAEFVRSRKSR